MSRRLYFSTMTQDTVVFICTEKFPRCGRSQRSLRFIRFGYDLKNFKTFKLGWENVLQEKRLTLNIYLYTLEYPKTYNTSFFMVTSSILRKLFVSSFYLDDLTWNNDPWVEEGTLLHVKLTHTSKIIRSLWHLKAASYRLDHVSCLVLI